MTEELIGELRNGVEVGDGKLFAKKIDEGRINNQKYLEMYLKTGVSEKLMFYISVYMGKEPHYKPWIEIFGINNEMYFNEGVIKYFGTEIEDKIIDLVSKSFGPGGRIFVEYSEDEETRYGLLRDYPEVITRFGYELYKRDFSWLKYWYYPEGFNEGGEKLQAEKPIDRKREEKHRKRIKEEVRKFLKGDYEENPYFERAKCRAEKILKDL